MLLVGSQALLAQGFPLGRVPRDTDYICTWEEFVCWQTDHKGRLSACYPLSGSKWVAFASGAAAPEIFEFEIAWPESTDAALIEWHWRDGRATNIATLNECYSLKLSHRYLKNSPAFLKTMTDIWALRKAGAWVPGGLKEWLLQREAETYSYAHPKLDRSKSEFFSGDMVTYVYDHDDVHKAVAVGSVPAYTLYAVDGQQVLSDKRKFFAADPQVQLDGVSEEAYVLAIERSLVPHPGVLTPRQAWLKALEKVCTSITSGWFREFAWENYYEVVGRYDPTYINKFKAAVAAGKVRKV